MIVTITSTKGGVGKTTLTANLGGILADLGHRVLLVDADIQPTLSSYFAFDRQSEQGLLDLFEHGTAEGTISHTRVGCDLVLSNDPEGRLSDFILHTPDGRLRLKTVLKHLDSEYDFILVDTQGAVGPLQDAAVLCADLLLSPIPPEILSTREFARGTLGMLERLAVMETLGFPLGPLFGLLYRMDRTLDARATTEALRRAAFGPSRGRIRILETVGTRYRGLPPGGQCPSARPPLRAGPAGTEPQWSGDPGGIAAGTAPGYRGGGHRAVGWRLRQTAGRRCRVSMDAPP
jgi:chromosome partitioning related protein ParA